MAATRITIAIAKKCFRQNKGKTRTIAILPGAVGAKGDITLPLRLDLRTPCPITSITHVDQTAAVDNYRHSLIGTGAASDQIVYENPAVHDAAHQFAIKSATVIQFNEATTVASILLIEAVWEDN